MEIKNEGKVKMFVSKNLKFLRESAGITIEKLSELTGVDPIMIWELEEDRIDVNRSNVEELIYISNFYKYPLDVIHLDDIEASGIKPEIDQMSLDQKITEDDTNFIGVTRETAMRKLLKSIQRLNIIQKKYDDLRAADLIPPIDFFERK